MACELIGNCPLEDLRVLKSALGPVANDFSLVDLREMVCKSESDEARVKDCPKFKKQQPELQKEKAKQHMGSHFARR